MTDSLTRPLAPLPINVRPRLGETTVHYVQRLARANHLKPSYLLRILTGPTPSRNVNVQLERLAALSGRSPDILKITLAGAAPPGLRVGTRDTVRLERIAARKGRHRSFSIVGQIRRNAHRSKGTLRQLSDQREMPRWLIKRILSPDSRSHSGETFLDERGDPRHSPGLLRTGNDTWTGLDRSPRQP